MNGLNAFVHRTVEFFYSSIFSDTDTWGGEFEPADGDSLFVPVGQVLLIDKSPFGVLNAIVVEGVLLFAENANGINLDARYIFVRHGRLIIGTEATPYTSKLVITMHGNIYDKQLPDVGNKCIACHQCRLDIHGTRRDKTWTELDATADIGATTITLTETVDWKVGEQIVIASTDFDHKHAEQRVISAISG